VGFVVCARSYEDFDGTKTELPLATGTCFAVSEKGYLLTNRHVVEGVSKYRDSQERRVAEKKSGLKIEPGVWVFFFEKPERKVVRRPATVVFETNPHDEIDLAVLKIDTGPGPLPFYFRLAPGGSEEGLKAKEVYALGFPAAARLPIVGGKDSRPVIREGTRIEELFQESDFDYVTERGIVNVVRKEAGKTHKVVEWVLHGAKIGPGNSGGPLITKDATVVGINTLVQRVVSDGETNYVALGMTQIRKQLVHHVPALSTELAASAHDPGMEGSNPPAHEGANR
jgi:S1-C subfamily serine protease